MFYLKRQSDNALALKGCKGEHDTRFTTHSCVNAEAFETFEEASDYSQNFGPDWVVVEY